MPSNKKLFIPAILSVLFFLNGCGVWTDFTTYFNTYYNARTLFDRTEADILKLKKDPFEFREDIRPIQQPAATIQVPRQGQTATQPVSSTQLKQDLTKVIEKCSKILQFYKESSYVDDALFMTGKAFYYQQEYASAQRKFLELAAIPESEYKLENKLWLAKTYLQLRSFEEGLDIIEEVKNESISENEEDLLIVAAITKISFLIFREEYKSAIDECNWIIGKIKNDETQALVSYQLGKTYLKIGEEENALNSFASVLKYSPTFEIEFESRLEYAKLLKQLGRIDESEVEFLDLRDRGKFKNQMDRILIEVGKVYYQKEQNDKAIEVFKEVDSTYKNNPTSGIAGFMLGEIYEKYYRDYDSSLKYYNKSASSFADREMKLEAGKRAKNLDRYFSLKNTLTDLDKQILYITRPEKFVQDSIDYDIAFKEYLTENQKRSDQSAQPIQQVPQQNIEGENPQQQAQRQFPRTQTQDTGEINLVTLIARGKVQKPVRPRISVDSVNTLISENFYDLGSHFFSELEVPDSAYHYFSTFLELFPDKPKKVQTIFALGTYYETIDKNDSADSLYKIIYDEFPNSTLHKEAGKKLGLIKEEEKKVITGTSDPVEGEYVQAEGLYYDKKYRDAIRAFRDIYLKHPTSSFSPKSIYYIGLIHEELGEYDSSAFYYGILSSKEYASTPLGKAVIAKYTEYKNEKDRIAQEEQIKLEAEKQKVIIEQNKVIPDSNAVKLPNGVPPVLKKEEAIDDVIKPDSLRKRISDKPPVDADTKEKTDTTKRKIPD
ncbi:MAG: tetratricopeptide repeat protein [Melioribacteraceae bacterium]|nr:tetratricopeptide repeat protein [Melioribacteraceae bacterium]